MNGSPAYPFSDLSLQDLERLVDAARAERTRTIRTMFLRLAKALKRQSSVRIECEPPATFASSRT